MSYTISGCLTRKPQGQFAAFLLMLWLIILQYVTNFLHGFVVLFGLRIFYNILLRFSYFELHNEINYADLNGLKKQAILVILWNFIITRRKTPAKNEFSYIGKTFINEIFLHFLQFCGLS